MILLDYIINLSIFSLLVSIPLIIASFLHIKPLKKIRFWVGLYGGMVSIILVLLSIHHKGFSYDIRYAPIILVFAYFGPAAGMISGACAILIRLFSSGQWTPAIIGWCIIMLVFTLLHLYMKSFTFIKKCIVLFVAFTVIYVVTVPILFNVLRDQLFFHLQYILFVMFGVVIGVLLIESYEKLFRLNRRLTDMYKRVEESESKYRIIAENTSDLIVVIDKEQMIYYSSPSHVQVLGYPESELKRFSLYTLIHPDDVGLLGDSISRLFTHKELQSLEIRLQHKDGRWIEFESRCMPVLGENEEVENIVIVSRDISERKKSEEILLQSEKLSILGELAAGVAHEIRNPLTTIKGFIQLYKADRPAIEHNDILLSELERIETITSELLSLGKPQAVQLNQINISELVEGTLELLSPQALMNKIQFRFVEEGMPLTIIGEKNQLKQVFLNILKNAIEAMPHGGDIDIHLRKGLHEECILSFQDQGCGIPKEILPRLGEPFYSLKEKGTGLGVLICHKIIKQHNGSITYTSEIQQGTLVEIKLPLAS